ncbi:MAG: winged helix-turn-helix domain-containing protein, partial [Pseudomonadota bacterium]
MTDNYSSPSSSRPEPAQGRGDVYIGDWLVSLSGCTLSRGDGEVKVTPRSMDVLKLLCERADTVVSPAELLEAVWRSPIATDHAVHKAIAELRGALGDRAQKPTYIKTIPKRGYKLIAPVSPAGASSTATNDGVDPERTAPNATDPNGKLPPERRSRPYLALAAALVLTLLVSVPLWLDRQVSPDREGGPISLAVIPFSIQDYNDENQIIAEGIRDALVHGLSKLDNLQVMSPPRNSGYRESSDARYDGYLDEADHRLQGSVFTGDGRLRVIVQLVRQEDAVQQYSEQFDLPLTDIFS